MTIDGAAFALAAIAYLALAALILLQARRSATGALLAGAALASALWAVAALIPQAPPNAVAGFDLLHGLAWFGFCLHLYRRALPGARATAGFAAFGLAVLIGAAAATITGRAGLDGATGLGLASPAVLLRLALALAQLLLLENVWRSQRRGPVGLAVVALGGLAAYDVMVCADAVMLHVTMAGLLAGRAVIALFAVPLLALAAARNRDWRIDIHVSRAAVFHSATLLVSGTFLIALAAAGEVARRVGERLGLGWGTLAELCVAFAGAVTLAAVLSSPGVRRLLRRFLVEHFFTHRYDYRREWQHCINTLAAGAASATPLQERVLQALARPVDSPAGLLFLREAGVLRWAGAWQTAPSGTLPVAEALLEKAARPFELATADAANDRFPAWLAVPLPDPDPAQAASLGVIFLARPRAAFRIDGEVIDLLAVLAHEVAVHLAQARSAAALLETRDLRAFGERFAFVAHDIKNVSSQLSLLLSNAETHLADPDFQADMLATVRASISRIGGLIRRLQPSEPAAAVATIEPAGLLAAALAARAGPPVALLAEGSAQGALVAMAAAAFEAAVGHLVNNAVTAAGGAGRAHVALRANATEVTIDVVDDGPGMSAAFVRDRLFTPFATDTEGGSGIGAYQARALVRAAGGDLTVLSTPGKGTTMRIGLPRALAARRDEAA